VNVSLTGAVWYNRFALFAFVKNIDVFITANYRMCFPDVCYLLIRMTFKVVNSPVFHLLV
jgi:hypothetical protein